MTKDTIFIVDDVPANLGVLFDSLEEAGYKTLIYNNGESVLNAIDRVQPDLILLDVMLPDIDGFEVCRRLKADKAHRDVPIIFITALWDTIDEIKGLKLGAVDYITKPIQIEIVLARVRTHLMLHKLKNQLRVRTAELETKNAQLQEALENIKTLKGLLPVCANCHKIRDEKGYWNLFEDHISNHSDALISHSICPECIHELYNGEEWYGNKHAEK